MGNKAPLASGAAPDPFGAPRLAASRDGNKTNCYHPRRGAGGAALPKQREFMRHRHMAPFANQVCRAKEAYTPLREALNLLARISI